MTVIDIIVGTLFGFVAGLVFGIFVMALMYAAKEDEDER